MPRRQRDAKSPGLRWPKWLDDYESWHLLHVTAFGVYKEQAFAGDARRYKISRKLLATAREQLKRFEDSSLPQRVRVAAGKRAERQFTEAQRLARAREHAMEGRLFGDQVVAGVSVNGHPTGALVATCFPRTVMDRDIARHVGARLTGRERALMYKGLRLEGRYAKVTVAFDGASADIIAFVPRGRFTKGLMLGWDWVQHAGVRVVDDELVIADHHLDRHGKPMARQVQRTKK